MPDLPAPVAPSAAQRTAWLLFAPPAWWQACAGCCSGRASAERGRLAPSRHPPLALDATPLAVVRPAFWRWGQAGWAPMDGPRGSPWPGCAAGAPGAGGPGWRCGWGQRRCCGGMPTGRVWPLAPAGRGSACPRMPSAGAHGGTELLLLRGRPGRRAALVVDADGGVVVARQRPALAARRSRRSRALAGRCDAAAPNLIMAP